MESLEEEQNRLKKEFLTKVEEGEGDGDFWVKKEKTAEEVSTFLKIIMRDVRPPRKTISSWNGRKPTLMSLQN